MTFDVTLLWPAFAAVGMLKVARLCRVNEPEPLTVMVGFVSPDVRQYNGATQTAQYEIEYQTVDLPDLEQGDELEIENVSIGACGHGVTRFRVRIPVYIPENPYEGNDGTYRRALLTKI